MYTAPKRLKLDGSALKLIEESVGGWKYGGYPSERALDIHQKGP
jgi:hypothetical protein